MTGSSQLTRLATPIPDKFIEKRQNQSYVAHEVVTQWLLYVIGPFSFELVQVFRGDVLTRNKEQGTPPFSDAHSEIILRDVIVGATYRLTCLIDGRLTVVEHTGDVDQPTNWQHDGARLKDAESDAIKRCAREVGVALHLWAGGEYFLDKWLAKRDGQPATSPGPDTAVEDQASASGKDSGSRRVGPSTVVAAGPGGTTPAGAVESEDRPASAPAGPATTPGGAADGEGSRPAGTTPTATATVADLEQIAAARGKNLNAFARAIRDAAKAGELPAKFARVTVAKLDTMLPADLGLFAVWAQGGDTSAAGDPLIDSIVADTPAGAP